MKFFLSLSISCFFTSLVFSQDEIKFIENNSFNCEQIDYFLEFENIIFKNYILSNSNFVNTKIYFYEYFNDLEIQQGELKYVKGIRNNSKIENDSTFDIKLFLKVTENDKIKIGLSNGYKNLELKYLKEFVKIKSEPSTLDFVFDSDNQIATNYFRIVISYSTERDLMYFDQIYASVRKEKFKTIYHEEDDIDRHYFVFEYLIN